MELVSIIIPTYNERKNIISLIDEINKALPDQIFEIIIIDDNSPDQTFNLVKEKFKNFKNIFPYKREGKKGLVKSLDFGISRSKGDILVFMDGDHSHPPQTIINLILKLSKYDLAIASRYVKGGLDDRDDVKFHRFLSKMISYLYYFLTGIPIKDITSGFFAIKRHHLRPFQGNHGEYFIDLISKLWEKGTKITEVPYTNINRRAGISKTGRNPLELIFRGFPYILMVLKHFKLKRKLIVN
jgi:dolichol-phosphate mannosyltransferase